MCVSVFERRVTLGNGPRSIESVRQGLETSKNRESEQIRGGGDAGRNEANNGREMFFPFPTSVPLALFPFLSRLLVEGWYICKISAVLRI